MPTVIYGNAQDYLELKSERFSVLVERPVGEPYPNEVENVLSFSGAWIAGSVNGMMHWRFENPEDASLFCTTYPEEFR